MSVSSLYDVLCYEPNLNKRRSEVLEAVHKSIDRGMQIVELRNALKYCIEEGDLGGSRDLPEWIEKIMTASATA